MKRLLLLAFGIWACSPYTNYERPTEMWVFRSVLDEKPRMLTAALDDNLWVAYDVQNALMYKAWKGGVNFDGAVYTTVHGPQPTSEGYAYFESLEDKWLLKNGSGVENPDVKYEGHRIVDQQLQLRYDLTDSEGNLISITETPEYIRRGNQNGLHRKFEIRNSTGRQVVLRTVLGSLLHEGDFSTDGTFETQEKKKVEFTEGSVYEIRGALTLNDGFTSLKTFYHPGFDKLSVAFLDEDEEVLDVPRGALLIEQSDCETCHNEQLKTVGPAYVAVARKYNDTDETIAMLAGNVINGGSGVWGEALMTAHPDLQPNDAADMIRYILSLDDEDPGGQYSKYTLGIKSIPIKLQTEYISPGGKGFMTHAYMKFGDAGIDDVIKTTPVKQGPVSKIHVMDALGFDEFREDFVLVFRGILTIEETGSYDFRLISDDGSFLYIDDNLIIDNGGLHGPRPIDGEMYLTAGDHSIELHYFQGKGGAALSLQWFSKQTQQFELVDDQVVSFTSTQILKTQPYVPASQLTKSIPGDAEPLIAVHPSFDISQARPESFKPRVGGIDFFSDGSMAVCTWDSLGPVYRIDNWQSGKPEQISVKKIAMGLAEPLGLKILDDELYVLQKQELTHLIDHDGDQIIDEFRTVSDKWKVSSNFHEFAFGLVYQDDHFYATLATAILPGGASADPQIPDRGKVVKIHRETGETSFIAHGLRTPNGIGIGMGGKIFVADNQGDWLPSSKIVHIEPGNWYGSRSVDFEGTADLEETLPVVWLPQDEIGNSPSTPMGIEIGPYAGQLIHGEVTNGGIKRVFAEEVNGTIQGAVFRFTQGLEAGINRISWAPDGSLVAGGVGSSGNWGHSDKYWYGLQRLAYNEKSTFEMLEVRARTNGFEIAFTEPIKKGQNINKDDFLVRQWYYQPTVNYGGPKLDLEDLRIRNLYISEDRKTVFLELPGIRSNHVVYFRIVRPFQSESDHELWSTEAWYTLNEIPADAPGSANDYAPKHNQLTEEEIADGWKLLFDGRSTRGIRNFKSEALGKKWIATDGTLHFLGKGTGDGWQAKDGGDIIITDKEYEDFELYLEWKISAGGNSGIIYNVIESDEYDFVWQTGPEMQILDNVRHPDGQIDIHRAGDLYDLIPSKYVTVNEVGEWNRVRLIVNDGKVQQWQNGYMVVEYELWTEEWNDMVSKSKFRDMPGFGTGQRGHVALQDHGDKVWFRNIKIREL